MHVREQKMKSLLALFLAVNRSRARSWRPNILPSRGMLLNRMKENKAINISRLENEDRTTDTAQLTRMATVSESKIQDP